MLEHNCDTTNLKATDSWHCGSHSAITLIQYPAGTDLHSLWTQQKHQNHSNWPPQFNTPLPHSTYNIATIHTCKHTHVISCQVHTCTHKAGIHAEAASGSSLALYGVSFITQGLFTLPRSQRKQQWGSLTSSELENDTITRETGSDVWRKKDKAQAIGWRMW